MNIQPVIFTYSEQGPAAIECASRCIECGFSLPILLDDGNAPMQPEVVAYLQRMGATVRQTQWPRGRNLVGIAAFSGMRLAYSSIFETNAADCILRLDADVLVVDPDKVRASASTTTVVGQVVPGHGLIGGCHLIGREARIGSSRELARAQECQHMGSAAAECLDGRSDWLAAWPMTEQLSAPRLRAWASVEFGRLKQLSGRKCERREQAAMIMAKARRLLA